MLALLCPLWTSCDDGEGPKSPNNTAVEISWLMPTDRECGTETEITLTLASVSDGTQKEIALTQNGEIVTVADDLYNVTLSIKPSVNGQVLDEPYVNTPTNLSYDMTFPVTVPEGKLFVLGDNRNDSLDSRSTDIGFINENKVLGKVVFRFYPFDKIEIIKN